MDHVILINGDRNPGKLSKVIGFNHFANKLQAESIL